MGESKRRIQSGKISSAKPEQSRKVLLWTLSGIGLIVVVGLVLWLSKPPLPEANRQAEPFPSKMDRYGISLGDKNAPVVVREFADYQCAACARFSEAMKKLKEKHVESGEVRVVFFDFPFRQHKNAFIAAEAARCAKDQRAYWKMHDKLFEFQSNWANSSDPQAKFIKYAKSIGLDAQRFTRCLIDHKHKSAVQRSMRIAGELRIRSTPTVFVNNIPLSSAGWPQLSAVVARELQDK